MSNTRLTAGTAKVDITTLDESHVNDRLHGRILTLCQGDVTFVIIALDAVAIGGIEEIPDDFLERLRNELKTRYNIKPEHLLLSASHTHTAPPMIREPEDLLALLSDAVGNALNNQEAVEFGYGSGCEKRIAVNRAIKMQDGSGWAMRQCHPCPPEDEIIGLGETDPEIGIFKFSRLDGTTKAVIFNFACHPLFGLNLKASAKYPGVAAGIIEDTLGCNATALFFQGAAGNINEIGYKDLNFPYYTEFNGMLLALGVLKELPHIKCQSVKMASSFRSMTFPRRNDIPLLVEKIRAERDKLVEDFRYNSLNLKTFLPLYMKHLISPEYPNDYSYRYLQAAADGDEHYKELDAMNKDSLNTYLKNIRNMEKISKLDDDIQTLLRHKKINDDSCSDHIEGEAVILQIGDAAIISAPLELIAEIGLKLKKESPFSQTLIAAYSNGYMHYGNTPEHYASGAYEARECFLAPEWLDIYLGNIKSMQDELIKNRIK